MRHNVLRKGFQILIILLIGVFIVIACKMNDHIFNDAKAGGAPDNRESDPGSSTDSDADTESDTQPGTSPDSDTVSPCVGSFADRLTVTVVSLDEEAVYLRPWYDNALADSRILLAAAPNGTAWAAWTSTNGTVHLTPLTADLTRAGDDILVPGYDIGGLAAHNDGVAALVLKDDPDRDEIALAADEPTYAVHLIRIRGTEPVFDARLTGPGGLDGERDFVNNFGSSSLKWDGERYGAYLLIRGGAEHASQGRYGDKLIYLDDEGQSLSGGFSWECSISYYHRLLPEIDAPFTAICMEDGTSQGGVYVAGLGEKREIAKEEATAGWIGAKMGGIVKLPDNRYMVAWSSQWGVSSNAYDIAVSYLNADRIPTGTRRWLTDTTDMSEENLHIALFGDDHILVAYSVYENAVCNTTCVGDYGGMRFRLMDFNGNWVDDAERLEVRPPDEDEMAVFPNRDIGFAFVDHDIPYGQQNALELSNPPPFNELKIARLGYCDMGIVSDADADTDTDTDMETDTNEDTDSDAVSTAAATRAPPSAPHRQR